MQAPKASFPTSSLRCSFTAFGPSAASLLQDSKPSHPQENKKTTTTGDRRTYTPPAAAPLATTFFATSRPHPLPGCGDGASGWARFRRLDRADRVSSHVGASGTMTSPNGRDAETKLGCRSRSSARRRACDPQPSAIAMHDDTQPCSHLCKPVDLPDSLETHQHVLDNQWNSDGCRNSTGTECLMAMPS